MTKRAFILGAGQIGRAATQALRLGGWEVDVAARHPLDPADEMLRLGARSVVLDRRHQGALKAAVAGGADVVVDSVCFDADDAGQLLSLGDSVGHLVMISSLSVYTDDRSKTLDQATDASSFPHFPATVDEDQPTVAAGPASYSTRKVAAEDRLLDQTATPVTVLRPGAIHGRSNRAAREWWMVKRILDDRRVVMLAHRGESRFQTTSCAALAEMIRLAAERPGTRVLNVTDPDSPTAREIGRTIAHHLDHDWIEVLLPGPAVGTAGDHPWNVPLPFVATSRRAEDELGYVPVGTYGETVGPALDWLVERVPRQAWPDALPGLAAYPDDQFDYAAEDGVLAELTGRAARPRD